MSIIKRKYHKDTMDIVPSIRNKTVWEDDYDREIAVNIYDYEKIGQTVLELFNELKEEIENA